jgi:DNA mismatch repair protein MutS2
VSALDRAGRRATLETGGMRVSVELEDLELLDGAGEVEGREGRGAATPREAAGAGTNVGAIRLARARTVPMSLDLRGARVDEALGALGTYLEDASLAGLERVTVIHGLGTGALRDAVRSESAAHPLVTSIRAGEKGEGGDGVTVVTLG